MGRTSASQCVAGPEPGLRKHVVLSVELGDAVLCWHLLWLPPRASAADSSAPTRVGGRPGPQCGPLRSPLCAAQTSVSGMPGGEEERPCPAGWLLCRGRHANAARSASTGLLPPAPPRRPAHLGLRATAGGGLPPPRHSAWDSCPRPAPPARMHGTWWRACVLFAHVPSV